MHKKILIAPVVLLILACSVFTPPTPTPTDSGVEGQALLGPMCPVVRVGEECPDQPYQALITVNSPEGRKIAQVQADEQGYFRIPLSPGDYILHPETPEGNPFPFADEQPFTVHAGQFTHIIVLYDSGIR